MAELWETDVRVFLTLTGLARKYTEHKAGRLDLHLFEAAMKQACGHYPALPRDEVVELARRVEKFRNESICKVAMRVPPLRKIVSRESVTDDVLHVSMDCGHERDIKTRDFQRMTRCRECLRIERTVIAQNFRSVSKMR